VYPRTHTWRRALPIVSGIWATRCASSAATLDTPSTVFLAIDRNGTMPVYWRDCPSRQPPDAERTAGVRDVMDVDRANSPIVAGAVSANYADVLRVEAALGRWFSLDDEAPGAEPAVVISRHTWERYFHRCQPPRAGCLRWRGADLVFRRRVGELPSGPACGRRPGTIPAV
jgi:hypothetical protein